MDRYRLTYIKAMTHINCSDDLYSSNRQNSCCLKIMLLPVFTAWVISQIKDGKVGDQVVQYQRVNPRKIGPKSNLSFQNLFIAHTKNRIILTAIPHEIIWCKRVRRSNAYICLTLVHI